MTKFGKYLATPNRHSQVLYFLINTKYRPESSNRFNYSENDKVRPEILQDNYSEKAR